MMTREFCYNINGQYWQIENNECIKGKEIEDIPILIILEYADDNYVWCNKHKAFEKIVNNDNISWESISCRFKGISAFFKYQDHNFDTTYPNVNYQKIRIPVRWRLSINKSYSILFAGVDICDVIISHSNQPPMYCVPRIRKYLYGNATYDLKTEEAHYFQEQLAYPPDISDNLVEMLQEIAQNIYGLKPNRANTDLDIEDYIKAFLFRPYDLSCYFLRKYANMNLVAKDCKNAYHIVCQQLQTNPPKGLKKLYHYNPFVIPMYKTLIELGFTDYNLMRPFFTGDKIGDMCFSECSIYDFPFWDTGEVDKEIKEFESSNKEKNAQQYVTARPVELVNAMETAKPRLDEGKGVITQEEIDALLGGTFVSDINKPREHKEWNKLQFFVNWIMQAKGEMVTARRLYKYTTEATSIKRDICNMIYEHFDCISDDIKAEFLKKGCTVVIHDKLVYEINRLDYVRKRLKYRPYIEDLECEINGYRFELPRYTDELVEIGREMNNCAASYISKVQCGKSVIIVIRKQNGTLACIEVDNKGNIIEALGINNMALRDDILTVVILWAKKMLLFDESLYLNSVCPTMA